MELDLLVQQYKKINKRKKIEGNLYRLKLKRRFKKIKEIRKRVKFVKHDIRNLKSLKKISKR